MTELTCQLSFRGLQHLRKPPIALAVIDDLILLGDSLGSSARTPHSHVSA